MDVVKELENQATMKNGALNVFLHNFLSFFSKKLGLTVALGELGASSCFLAKELDVLEPLFMGLCTLLKQFPG